MIKILLGILATTSLITPVFAADTPSPLRIALVSDTHTTRGTAEDQPLYKEHLVHVIASVNSAKVDAVLVAGDLTQGGKPGEMTDFLAQIKGFQAPVSFVYGNHDVGGKHAPGVKGGVTADRVTRAEQTFGSLSFWSRAFAGIRVVGINSSLLGSGLPEEAEQWSFLENELKAPSKEPTILLMHYPLFVKSAGEPGGEYWNVEPLPRARLIALLQSGGVRAVLTGHLHKSLTAQQNGIFLYTTPPVSFGLPRGKQPEGWTLVTISQSGDVTADFHPTDAPLQELPKKE